MILLKLFLAFMKIGAFSFGGGYAMLPLIENEVINKNGWIDYETFVDVIAIAEVTPGPIAINSATFIGYRISGIPGSVVSTLGVIFIPTILILILTRFVLKFKESKLVKAIFSGLRPALVGLILASAFSVGKTQLTNIQGIVIALLVFVIINKTKIHPILAIVLSGVLGFLFYR